MFRNSPFYSKVTIYFKHPSVCSFEKIWGNVNFLAATQDRWLIFFLEIIFTNEYSVYMLFSFFVCQSFYKRHICIFSSKVFIFFLSFWKLYTTCICICVWFQTIRNFGRNCLTLFNWERTTSFMSEKEILKTKKKRDELVITFIHIKSTKIFD